MARLLPARVGVLRSAASACYTAHRAYVNAGVYGLIAMTIAFEAMSSCYPSWHPGHTREDDDPLRPAKARQRVRLVQDPGSQSTEALAALALDAVAEPPVPQR